MYNIWPRNVCCVSLPTWLWRADPHEGQAVYYAVAAGAPHRHQLRTHRHLRPAGDGVGGATLGGNITDTAKLVPDGEDEA